MIVDINDFISVTARPVVPQFVVTFQFEHLKNMCFIASVLHNPTEAITMDYTIRVDRANVPYRNAQFLSNNGVSSNTLIYELNCTKHNVSIIANNICGESPGAAEIVLDPNQRIILNVTLFAIGHASNIQCKSL